MTNYIIFATTSVTSAPFGEAPKHYQHNSLHVYGIDETRKH